VFLIIGRVEFFEHLRPYFFTTDMDFWRDVFKPDVPWQSFQHYGSICGAYTFGTLLSGADDFRTQRHQDLNMLAKSLLIALCLLMIAGAIQVRSVALADASGCGCARWPAPALANLEYWVRRAGR
jgi:hypothetical protein